MHAHELAQLIHLDLQRQNAPYSCQLKEGLFEFQRTDTTTTKFQIEFVASPASQRISLGDVLGFSHKQYSSGGDENTLKSVRVPAYMRARVEPGFYVSPPSLFANAVEEAYQSRMNLQQLNASTTHTFSLCQMDASFTEIVNVPPGVYWPERLRNVLQELMTDINIQLEYVNREEVSCDDWIRFTFTSSEHVPFMLDFSANTSQKIARALGFRGRRYAGRSQYVGEAFAVPSSRNVMPAPAPSLIQGGIRPYLKGYEMPRFRYPRAVLTVTGSTPNTQHFTLLSEPENHFAAVNTQSNYQYFHNIRSAGIVDLCTRSISKQQAYNFRVGDVCRLTGYTKDQHELHLVTGSDGTLGVSNSHRDGVQHVIVDTIGGAGYRRAPSIVAQIGGQRTILPAACTIYDGKLKSIQLPYTSDVPIDAVAAVGDSVHITLHGNGLGALQAYDGIQTTGFPILIVNATGAFENQPVYIQYISSNVDSYGNTIEQTFAVVGSTAADVGNIPATASVAFLNNPGVFPPQFTSYPELVVEAPPQPSLSSLEIKQSTAPNTLHIRFSLSAPMYVVIGDCIVIQNSSISLLNGPQKIDALFESDGTTAAATHTDSTQIIECTMPLYHDTDTTGLTIGASYASHNAGTATAYAAVTKPIHINCFDTRHPDDRASTTNAYAGWSSALDNGVFTSSGQTTRLLCCQQDMIDSPSAVETLKQVTSSQVRSIPRGEETSNGFIGFRTAISRVDEDSGNLRVFYKKTWNEFGPDGSQSANNSVPAQFAELGNGDEVVIAGTRLNSTDTQHLDGVWTVVNGPRDGLTSGNNDEGLIYLQAASHTVQTRDYREAGSSFHDYDQFTLTSTAAGTVQSAARVFPTLACTRVDGSSKAGTYQFNETIGLYQENPGNVDSLTDTLFDSTPYKAQRHHVNAMELDNGSRPAATAFGTHFKRLKSGSNASNNDWGVGGFLVYAPAPKEAELAAWMNGGYVIRAQPAQSGFLNRANYAETSGIDQGPPVTFASGTLNDQYIGATAPGGPARASSYLKNGNLVSSSSSNKTGSRIETLTQNGEARVVQILFAYAPDRFEVAQNGTNPLASTSGVVRLVFEIPIRDDQDSTTCFFADQDVTLHNFWPFTAGSFTFTPSSDVNSTQPGTWRLITTATVGNRYEIEIAPSSATLQSDFATGTAQKAGLPENVWNSSVRSITLSDGSVQYGRQHFGGVTIFENSDLTIDYAGDYSSISTLTASVTMVQEMATRTAIVTSHTYDSQDRFRWIFEYNPNGLNDGHGFRDAASGNIVLTFSHIYNPRTEYFSKRVIVSRS